MKVELKIFIETQSPNRPEDGAVFIMADAQDISPGALGDRWIVPEESYDRHRFRALLRERINEALEDALDNTYNSDVYPLWLSARDPMVGQYGPTEETQS